MLIISNRKLDIKSILVKLNASSWTDLKGKFIIYDHVNSLDKAKSYVHNQGLKNESNYYYLVNKSNKTVTDISDNIITNKKIFFGRVLPRNFFGRLK